MALYSDINQYNPNVKPILTEIEAIYQSLYNLFGTSTGERKFRPEIGLDIEDEVFELADDDLEFVILNRITKKLEFHEPRVIVNRSESSFLEISDNTYLLKLGFTLRGSSLNKIYEFQGNFNR